MKKRTKNKKITIDDLAGMMNRGFAKTAKQSDLEAVKIDVAGLKDDVAILKGDVAGLKEDVATLKNDVASIKEDFHKILDSLDKVAKQYAAYLEEKEVRDVQMARMKKWIEQIAQKIGVNLEP